MASNGAEGLLSLPPDLLRVIGRHVGRDYVADLLHFAQACRWVHDAVGPLLPFRAGEPEPAPVLLDWNHNYLRKHVMSNYHLLVATETPLATNPLVRAAASSLHVWWYEDSCLGFDVIEFLVAGKLCTFWDTSLSVIAERFLQSACVISDAPITVRHATGSLPPGIMCKNVVQTVDRMWRVGPLLRVRSVAAVLGVALDIMQRELASDPVADWLRTLWLLFQLARLTHRWDALHPNVARLLGSPLDCGLVELLDRLKDVCNTVNFSRYDGYFGAHSCGELYARPFLDLAAVLAHAAVFFEKEEHSATDSYLARNVEDLPERHWVDVTVAGLAILFFAFLGSQRHCKYKILRFDSEQFSGDHCSIASYDADQLPSKLIGSHTAHFAAGSRFVVASYSRSFASQVRPSVKFSNFLTKKDPSTIILMIEPHRRLTLL